MNPMLILTLVLLGNVNQCGYDLESEHLTIPPKLEAAVGFWQDVYSKYDSDTVIVHDRDNVSAVWDVLKIPNTVTGAKQLKRYTDVLASKLKHVERGSRSAESRRLLALAGGTITGSSERIRTQRGLADRFRAAIDRYRVLKVPIQEQLRTHAVIEELAALPFVESMFVPYAASSVGAAGMWQLMPDVARSLGLRVTRRNDERLDPAKATQAAARILQHNYAVLGSWDLAITAYNHGLNGMLRAKTQCGECLEDVLGCYESPTFGFASKSFYAEFIAAWDLVRDIE
jgi:membrane-bound lytic murein transglycosylase D